MTYVLTRAANSSLLTSLQHPMNERVLVDLLGLDFLELEAAIEGVA